MIPERLEPVLAELRPLADRFVAAGHRVYLVGGTVRDLLLDRPITGDFDLTTDARPSETKAVLEGWADAMWTQGERFGTIGTRKGDAVVRDHDPPRRGLSPRLSQARGGVLRRRSRPTSPVATSP